MAIISFHSLWTVVIFVCFIGIVLWAYSGRRKTEFDEAANLVFADEVFADEVLANEEISKEKTGEDNK